MRAVIIPRWNSTCSTSTAVSPPKVRRTSSTTRIGSGFLTPGTASTASSALPGIELDLPLVAEEALRSEDRQQHQGEADEHHAHLPDLRAVHDRLGDVPGTDG